MFSSRGSNVVHYTREYTCGLSREIAYGEIAPIIKKREAQEIISSRPRCRGISYIFNYTSRTRAIAIGNAE